MTALFRRHWWLWASFRYIALVSLGYWIAYLLRFDFVIPGHERTVFYRGFAVAVSVKLLVCLALGLKMERWWPYQGFPDLIRLLGTSALASAISGTLIFVFVGPEFPRSIYLLDPLVCFLLIGGARFGMRLFDEARAQWTSKTGEQKGLLIYGAGVAGIALAREIRGNDKLGYKVLGFLDDDSAKHGSQLMGLQVLGSGGQAARIVKEAAHRKGMPVAEIAVAMPAATGVEIRAAVAKGKAAGVTCRIVPGLGELISGRLAVGKMREISVTDLLGRDPVPMDADTVRESVAGRVVLVTGAAGSIGSELCRQIAQLGVRKLITLDVAESPLFFLEQELRGKHQDLNLRVEIGDIRDASHMERVIEDNGVEAIYHAAAFKHVPMMERQVCEAVRNNVIGTWNLVQAARRGRVSSFVLISTDKAVNPSSIMGLTKRVAELIVSARQPASANGNKRFVAVRFGNVLVSNGSVVPIFEKQIAMGGPVMVTHPDMRRYFMTVQEAVHLVLQAGAMGQGSEVFLLDMGQPVKIMDLARNMIRLAGFEPGEDIEIKIAGMRPGEKLFEELSLGNENTTPTTHPKIGSVRGRPLSMHELAPWLAELQHKLMRRDSEAVTSHLARLVPEYRSTLTEAPSPIATLLDTSRPHEAPAGKAIHLSTPAAA